MIRYVIKIKWKPDATGRQKTETDNRQTDRQKWKGDKKMEDRRQIIETDNRQMEGR